MQRLLGLFASETGLIWLLHRAAPMFPVELAHPGTWLRFTPPDQIVMAGMRYAALGLSYWLLLSTIIYTMGLLAKVPRLVGAVEWATLPMIRSAARRAVALSLATTTMAPAAVLMLPAVADSHQAVGEDLGQDERDPDAIVIEIPDRDVFLPPGATLPRNSSTSVPYVATPRFTAPTTNPGTPYRMAARPTVTGEEAPIDVRGGAEHTVEPGDNLWKIAADYLGTANPDRRVTQSQVASYWARVVELNRPFLLSQNPDWIYPGEEIQLPPMNE